MTAVSPFGFIRAEKRVVSGKSQRRQEDAFCGRRRGELRTSWRCVCVHCPNSRAVEAGWVGVHPSSEQHLILILKRQLASAQLKRQTGPSTSAPALSGTVAAVPGRGSNPDFQSPGSGHFKIRWYFEDFIHWKEFPPPPISDCVVRG